MPYGVVPESEPYDLLINLDGWKKIQIKSSWYTKPSGALEFSLKRTRNNAVRTTIKRYSGIEVDYFFLYNYSISWMIPFGKLAGLSRVTPGNRFDEHLISRDGGIGRRAGLKIQCQ